jgi:hypothetical protein
MVRLCEPVFRHGYAGAVLGHMSRDEVTVASEDRTAR